MRTTWRVKRAAAAQAALAVDILQEAASWSARIGPPVWSADEFDSATYERAACDGELVMGYEDGNAVACMLLQCRDERYWPNDPPGEALYAHKIAVRRAAAGRGWAARLLQWARADAERRGARYLRLDTLDRPKLLALYTGQGFRYVDVCAVHRCGDSIVRLELPLF